MQVRLDNWERVRLGRQRDNLTQARFAAQERVSQSVVSRWETGLAEIPPRVLERYGRVGRLAPHEQAAVLRRRIPVTVNKMAQLFGRSRYHIILMEQGRADSDEYLKFVVDLYNNTRV